jgi:dinuclear metal center YbgI/SA1388 family protein
VGTVKCQTIAGILDELAPKRLAESWDNVGLLVGDSKQKINRVMVCLDAPDWVVEEAIDKDVDMIISHHPMIFNGIKRITSDTATGRKLLSLIKNNIALYSLHTNYDIVAGGLNDIFARELGFSDSSVIEETYREELFKLAVYVPSGHEDRVINAMCSAGAGYIGKYSNCTFRAKGIGTFLPQEGTPLEDFKDKSSLSELKIISVLRLMFPKRLIPASLDLEGIDGMVHRLNAGANIVTSILPPDSRLEGVANYDRDLKDRDRDIKSVIRRLETMGMEPARQVEFESVLGC